MKRKTARLPPACLCALAVILTSCGRPPAPPARALTSIHMAGVYADAARVLASEFEHQTGIHVTIVAAPLLTLREKELTDLLTRGGHYDVMQVAYQWQGEILPHLRPLDEGSNHLVPDLRDFIPAVRTNCGLLGEKVYGLPMACDVITLLYRTDVFAARAAEFEKLTGRPLQPPRTWPEYIQMARFLNSDSLYGNIIMGREQNFAVWSSILHGMGGRLVDEQWRPMLNSALGAQSLSLFVEAFKYAPPHSENRSLTEANGLFLQGQGAMYLTWPSLIWAQLKDTNTCKIAGKIGAAVIPGGKPDLSAWSLGVNPACVDMDAACRWIDFFVNPVNTKRLLLQYGKGSPRVSSYSDPECRQEIFYLTALGQGFLGNQPRFSIPPSQELSDNLDNELLRAIRAECTPQAALDRTAARWRKTLSQSGFLPK